MNRVTQVVLARRALAFNLAFSDWLHEQSYSTAVAVLQPAARLCRELAHTLHELAARDRSTREGYAEELVASTTLLSALADTAFDHDAPHFFKNFHNLNMPGSFAHRDRPLTPELVCVDIREEVVLLESYCERMQIDQCRVFSVLSAFCQVAEQFASEICRLAPNPQDVNICELAVVARSASQTCCRVI